MPAHSHRSRRHDEATIKEGSDPDTPDELVYIYPRAPGGALHADCDDLLYEIGTLGLGSKATSTELSFYTHQDRCSGRDEDLGDCHRLALYEVTVWRYGLLRL